MAKLDREKLIEVIEAKQGIITAVAHSLNVSRRAIYDAAERWSTVKEAIDRARHDYDENLLDIAELKLKEAVIKGDSWSIRYVIDKKGVRRGYIDTQRSELTGAEGGPVEFSISDWHKNYEERRRRIEETADILNDDTSS